MIRCIIIEDEPLASKLLASYVEKIDDLDLLGVFENPFDAWSFLQAHDLELIFLDIQMPELNGIQLAKLIGQGAAIIFTTAYPDYAVDGFEVEALDYLVKPISLGRFLSAINRYKERKKSILHPEKASEVHYLFVKTEYRHQKIDFDDILYLKGMGDYVSILTKKGRVMTLENMKSFEASLPADRFMRVHKSYLIAMDKIAFVERNKININNELIPIGATYQELFWKRLKPS
ncbi:MAG: LytTR family DNA-binding domain-containing protein [Bacteroidota bacterium]